MRHEPSTGGTGARATDASSGLPTERRRVALSAVPGVAGGIVTAAATAWELGVLVGWVATSGVFVTWVWRDLRSLDVAGTMAAATREDDSRATSRVLLVGASVASLVAVAAGLREAAQQRAALEVALTATSLLAVVTSWAVVHTVFVLRYAHLYYSDEDGVGMDFPGGSRPTYRDFAYAAFTIGMTFQVSDTAITTAAMRGAVLRHALLSYVFGVAIIASTINVLASLVGR